MKILHIGSLGNGGRERRMVQLTRGLSAKGGIEQKLIPVFYEDIYVKDIPDDVEVVRLVGSRISSAQIIFNTIKSFRPDIVHIWIDIPLYLILLGFLKNLFGYKIVTGFIADGNIPNTDKITKSFRYIFSRSEAIVSNSKAGLIAKNAPSCKSHVIYNGFDFNRFKPFDKSSLYKELEIDSKSPVISMVARFSPAKNWDMFLNVAERLSTIRPEIQLLAIGGGSLLEKYKEQALSKGLKNIKFLGKRSDVENVLRLTDISVLFSNNDVHAEGVSNSIMESMAAGVPVIATDGGGTPEIISNEEDGYIVRPNDSNTAIAKIIKLLDDQELYKAFSLKAIQKVKSRFVLSDMADRYIQIYNECMQAR